MNKILSLLFGCLIFLFIFSLGSCGNQDKIIRVAASDIPHAQVLKECAADLLKEKGYKLVVKPLDWEFPNDSVAQGDFDANYFQHIPYLNEYKGKVELFAACKVHYEPLGIYRGKSTGPLSEAKTISICDDTSNAIRAFNLLFEKGVITNTPVSNGKLNFTGTEWISENGVKIKLISEAMLASSLPDYDFSCLPCNTAFTAKVKNEKVAYEDNSELVSQNANIIAARLKDYQNDKKYRAKIDALVEVMLSEEVSQYFKIKYNNVMTCDSTTQIDLRFVIGN